MNPDDLRLATRVGRVPWPPEWSQPARLRNGATVIFLCAFGCVGIAAGVSIFFPGSHDDRAYFLVLGAPLLFGVAFLIVLTRLRVRGRKSTSVHAGKTENGQSALILPYSRGLAATYLLVALTTTVLFVVVAVASLLALIETGTDAALVAQTVICVAFAAYLIWTLIEIAQKRLRSGAIILTATGVHHRSWAFDSYLTWEQAASVSAGELDGQLITLAAFTNAQPTIVRRSRLWKQPEYKLAPHTAIRGMYLTVDPGLAFHTLRFYYANPAIRAELGNDASVQRVRSGRVVSALHG